MKTYQKPATSKLVSRFDKELMNIIMSDLKALKEKNAATRLTAAQLIKTSILQTLTTRLPMKTYKKPATSKLVARFDNELMNLLMEDLKTFREKNQFVASNKQEVAQQQLSAA